MLVGLGVRRAAAVAGRAAPARALALALARAPARAGPLAMPWLPLQSGSGSGSGSASALATGARQRAQVLHDAETRKRNMSGMLYMLSIVVAGVGVCYASVPLYKVFCQVTGFGGTTRQVTMEEAKKMVPVPGARPITVEFAATTSDTMPWHFKPQQHEVRVVPGETALAFYTARNTSDKPVTGVATYNITPSKAGIYFNKIQCFCFDQQRLRPKEEVDMPVFFYIDPTFADDPQMAGVENIVLSYTFFPAKN